MLLRTPGTMTVLPSARPSTAAFATASLVTHMAFGSACFFVFLSNYITVSISPILVTIVTDFAIDFTRAGYLISVNLLFLGLGNLFWIPLAE